MNLLLLVTLSLSFADSTQTYYAEKNADALLEMCAHSVDRTESLLCQYRLYPLTKDDQYIDDLPTELDGGSARELALISGLWGYRAAQANIFQIIRLGGRSDHFLKEAQALDPDEPFVLLIQGQSLLFRPRFAGGDKREALQCFQKLYDIVSQHTDPGISPMEAQLWIWYTLEKMGEDAEADSLKRDLLAANPPALYREFLADPP